MNNVVWERLHTSSPLTMTAGDLNGDGADDVIMDFGPPYGIWIWSGNTFWIPWQTIGLVKSMATVDLNGDGWDELIADFGPFGVYTWRIVQGWTLFHPLSPEAIVTGELAP
jgi:hypothetical protein